MIRNIIVTCGLVTMCCWLAGAAEAVPRLVIEEPAFDFGFVPQNSRVSHVFWLKSAGDDSLKILKVVPGCGCTKAPLEKSELAAGDSTRLEVIFSTKRYRNKITKAPSIQTNEGAPHKRVHITTQVVAQPDSTFPIVIRPYKLDISQFGDEIRDEMKFTITNVSGEDLEVALIDRPEGYFDLELPGKIKAGGAAQGLLKLRPDVVDLAFEKSVTIGLNDEAASRFTIPVKRSKETMATRVQN